MLEKIWYLKRCKLFQMVPPEELQTLEYRCRFRQFPRGTPVYLPVDQANGVLLLTKGRVKICNFTEEGKQAILAFIEPGEIFGELSILETDSLREEYAEATEKASVILIPSDVMDGLVQKHPSVSLGITRLFGLRRKRIERRLKNLLYRSNRERLIHLLLELVEAYGKRTSLGIDLGIKLSHQDLASVIGSTRETVTVVLGELQAEGKLQLGRRKIMMTDLAALAANVGVAAPDIPR